MLWSGSVDSTLRVWDLASGKCLATLSAIAGAGGHTDAVSCLELVPGAGADTFVASGSADKTVKLWNTSGGTLAHTSTHSAMVTSLRAFKDSLGGKNMENYDSNRIICSAGNLSTVDTATM